MLSKPPPLSHLEILQFLICMGEVKSLCPIQL